MRVLLTGGAGFIGSHLARRLIQEGHHITIVDDLSTGKRQNVPSGAEFLPIDLSKTGFASHLPKSPYDAVCHLAAQSSGDISEENPLYDMQTNAVSTLLLSRWCLEHDIPHFLYASSMAIYGNVPKEKLPATEETLCAPLSYYGVSKLTSENLLRILNSRRFRTTSFRMFSVYGPGQNLENLKQGMVSIYLAYLLRKDPVPVTGSLDRFRDFIYIDDVIDAWHRALTHPATLSQVYNIGSGRSTTVRALLDLLLKTFHLPSNHPIQERPGSGSDQFGLYADIQRAKKDLGWQPRTGLEEGLEKMVKWAQSAVISLK